MPDSANGNEAEGFYGYDAEAGWAMDFYDEPLSNLVQEFSTEKTEEYEILPDDPESEQRRFQEKLEGFMQEQLPDLREPAKKTKEAQRSIWEAWKGYVSRNARKDPNQVILDLCRQLREAESICQAFLENYVERSVKPRLSLGPNEMENVRTVTSVNSVMQHWELLVGAAEREVLQRMRFKDSENTSLWRLAYKKKEDGIAEGPGMKIRRWIEGDMADKYSLLREQTFVKVEATIHDILLMLDILWTRAEDILCDPSTRLAMQQAIILDSMGGWRSGSLMEFCYQNVEVAVVRDPENHERTTLIAEITVQQNKRPSKRAQKSQDQIMSFTVTCVPCEKICLLRSLIACALQAGAFEAGFDSFETLLKQPKLENVDYVPLRWKEGMAKKPIVPIKYYTFWRIWHRILHVSEDLARLAFGDLAGRKDELNQFLRQSTYKRDDQAPLYPTSGDLAGFEKRKDVSLLREKHREAIVQHGSGSSAAKRAGAKVWDRVNALSALAVNRDLMCVENGAIERQRGKRNVFSAVTVLPGAAT
ncbi:hypothetical protein ColLi_05406 [Colletotrichum liriopes]|uniref:Uncharacterized protein n=1 Tax=Colletotrichum liriopes TaxID=708192 RepID=A0AA37GLU2_9PEZI|nr:hypothetical protein ColLi_05406 [Colletotrichum liriopes]